MSSKNFSHDYFNALQQLSPNALQIVAPVLNKDLKSSGLQLEKPVCLEARYLHQSETEIYNEIKTLDKKKKLAYHNLNHTLSVVKRVRSLLKKTKWQESEKQLVLIAAMFHDYQHGYMAYTRNKDFSNEEKSAIQADLFAKKVGLTLSQRVQLYGMIISTTFSQPSIYPQTKYEKLLVMADLGGFINTNREWLIESLNVILEIPLKKRPTSIREWLQFQNNFLGYVKKHLTSEAKTLRWDEVLHKKITMLQRLLKDPYYHKGFTPLILKIEESLNIKKN